jgi:hypothetical protein
MITGLLSGISARTHRNKANQVCDDCNNDSQDVQTLVVMHCMPDLSQFASQLPFLQVADFKVSYTSEPSLPEQVD